MVRVILTAAHAELNLRRFEKMHRNKIDSNEAMVFQTAHFVAGKTPVLEILIDEFLLWMSSSND